MYPIFNYGSPRFYVHEQLNVHFDTRQAAGMVVFEPVEEFITTLGGKSIPVFKGYRANVSLKLYNTRSSDSDQHIILMKVINHARQMRKAILLQPRYCNGRTLDLYVYPEGDFGYKEITNLNAGQSIELTFHSEELLTSLPLVSAIPAFLKIDKDSFLKLKNNHRVIV